MTCFICDKSFRSWAKFRRHCVDVHGANRAGLENAARTRPWSQLTLVATESGRPVLMFTDPMWPELERRGL